MLVSKNVNFHMRGGWTDCNCCLGRQQRAARRKWSSSSPPSSEFCGNNFYLRLFSSTNQVASSLITSINVKNGEEMNLANDDCKDSASRTKNLRLQSSVSDTYVRSSMNIHLIIVLHNILLYFRVQTAPRPF